MASLIHRDSTSGVNTSAVVVTSGSINMSGKIVAGDFLVATVYMACKVGTIGGFPAAPVGWSSPAGNSATDGPNTMGVIVFTKTAISADAGAAFTVDFTGLNIYVWAIKVVADYATDGVTPSLDGAIVFSASSGAVGSLNISPPTPTQNGDLIYLSAATYFGPLAGPGFGGTWFGNNGIAFAGGPYTGPVPIVGYHSYDPMGHLGGIGGGIDSGGSSDEMGLEGAYFGWPRTTGLPTPGFFCGTVTHVLAVAYAVKAAAPGVVFMGIWAPQNGCGNGFGGPTTSKTAGYMPGSPIAGTVLLAVVTQSGTGAGQTVTPPDGTWKAVAHVLDVTGLISADVFSHVVAGGDSTGATFSVPVAICMGVEIVTIGLLDTTTPVDAAAVISQPFVNGGTTAGGGVVAPSITPKLGDEVLIWFWCQTSSIGQFGGVSLSIGPSPAFFQGHGNGIDGIAAVGYGSLENCGTQYCYDSLAVLPNNPAAGVSLSLKAANAPAQPAANVRVDQMAIIALGLGGGGPPPPQCDAIA